MHKATQAATRVFLEMMDVYDHTVALETKHICHARSQLRMRVKLPMQESNAAECQTTVRPMQTFLSEPAPILSYLSCGYVGGA
jgi:hypothetical protein